MTDLKPVRYLILGSVGVLAEFSGSASAGELSEALKSCRAAFGKSSPLYTPNAGVNLCAVYETPAGRRYIRAPMAAGSLDHTFGAAHDIATMTNFPVVAFLSGAEGVRAEDHPIVIADYTTLAGVEEQYYAPGTRTLDQALCPYAE